MKRISQVNHLLREVPSCKHSDWLLNKKVKSPLSIRLSGCLNAFYEAGIKDDIFALIHEANKTNVISVKTPNGVTEKAAISNKIMQGDVLSPLVSSNAVDRNIGKVVKETGNFYVYKNKVKIPPLMM